MPAEQEMQQLKAEIAAVYARREQLKLALDAGALPSRLGLRRLEATDRALSELDTRYKALWDAAHPRVSMPAHPGRAVSADAADVKGSGQTY